MSNAVPSAEELMLELRFAQRIALRLVRDHHVADEVAQEAILAALQRPDVLAQKKRAWLVGVVRNLVHNRAREGRRRTEREARYIQDSSDAASPDGVSPAQEALQRGEQKARVANLVMALPEPYRTVIVLRYMEEISPPDIADKLGRPVETVKTQLRRGMAKLRDELDAESGGDGTTWALALLPLVAPKFPFGAGAAAASAPAGSASAGTAKVASAWGAGLATVAVVGVGAVAMLGWQHWRQDAQGDQAAEAPVLAGVDTLESDSLDASGAGESTMALIPLVPSSKRSPLTPIDPDGANTRAASGAGSGGGTEGPDAEEPAEELPFPTVEVVDAASGQPIPGVSIDYVGFSAGEWGLPEGGAELPEGETAPEPQLLPEGLGITSSFLVSKGLMDGAEDAIVLSELDAAQKGMDGNALGDTEPFHTAITDATGAAPLNEAKGTATFLTFEVKADGYAREDRFMEWREGEGSIRIALRRPGTFTIQRGAIDPRASVVVMVSDMVQKLCGIVTIDPGAEGEEVSDLPPGVYSLSGMAVIPDEANAPVFKFRDLVVKTTEGAPTVLELWKAERATLVATLEGAEPGEASRLRVTGRYLTGRATLELPFVNGEAVVHDLGGAMLQAEVLQAGVPLVTEALAMPGASALLPLKHTFALHTGALRIIGGTLPVVPDEEQFHYALADVGEGAGSSTVREGSAPFGQLREGVELDHLPPGRFVLWWSLGLRTGRAIVAVGAGESTVTLDDAPAATTAVTLKLCDCVFLGQAVTIYSADGASVPLDLTNHLICCLTEPTEEDLSSVELFLPAGNYVARWSSDDLAGDQQAFTVGLKPSTVTLHSTGEGALVTLNFVNGIIDGEVLISRLEGGSDPASNPAESEGVQGHLVVLDADRVVRLFLAPGRYRATDVQGRTGDFEVSSAQPTAFVEMQ